MAADMVYEGMRATAGPFLGTLGASAFTVGLVTGAGEAVALMLRLATGAWADHSGRHWRLTVIGYGMTAVCVPLLAVTPFIGGIGLAAASALILLERTGKAVRSPSKSALLARMATATGRGKGFAVHKAMDQVGAFGGPLLLAGSAALTGVLWPGYALLAIPGAAAMLLLAQLRRRVPSVAEPDPEDGPEPARGATGGLRASLGVDLPGTFHLFSLSAALTTAGLMTFGVISYRFVDIGLISLAAVPLVYALAMAVEAVAALATGGLFDRWGGRVLLGVPFLVAAVPLCVFADQLWLVLVGVVVWGVAYGIQDSTVKAYVADLVPARRRATAYGVFAAVQGVGALVGGGVAGALVTHHVGLLAVLVGVVQALAIILLAVTVVRQPGARPPAPAAAGPSPTSPR
ncbi:MFS transporter [Nocardioides humilatus]|uniref:MFS transporter n=2 Tax=Nocardioides humilatus TaxID=2607660 RepID=A0A5B1L5V0_9ACTN|nr:MFS transporter [Nocardioides humilatus]